MNKYQILIEKDQTGKGRYQLQLYIDSNALIKPFTAGINDFAEIGVYAIQLKEVIEKERNIKLSYSCIGFSEEIFQYKDVDESLKQFLENTTNYISPKVTNKVISIDKLKKNNGLFTHASKKSVYKEFNSLKKFNLIK